MTDTLNWFRVLAKDELPEGRVKTVVAGHTSIALSRFEGGYGALDNRLLAGFEYTAKYNLGADVPYEAYKSFEGRFQSGKQSGALVTYWANGQKKAQGDCVEGHWQGEWQCWKRDGTPDSAESGTYDLGEKAR